MDKLTSDLITTISEHPTNTYLRDKDSKISEAYKEIQDVYPTRDIQIPDEFDGREVWDGLITPVMNQGSCGSCWAFASSATLSDRFNIQSLGLINVQLSPTKLLLCDWEGKELELGDDLEENIKRVTELNVLSLKNAACFGNTLLDAWRYLYIIGIPTIECIPYDINLGLLSEYQQLGSFESVANVPLCTEISGPYKDMCSNYYIDHGIGVEGGDPSRFFSAYHFYNVPGTKEDNASEYNIRYDIYCWGPSTTAMRVYPDFYTFDAVNDIYEWNGRGEQVGGHAIELTGWGEENGVPYWQVKNTWGENWGDGGYFRIVRGKNMCSIEENVIVGIPNFFYPENYELNLTDEPDFFEKQREKMTLSLKTIGGGIEPTTGYTRRAMITYPWLTFSRPIDLEDLPVWSAFIAGIDASPYNRVRYQSVIKKRNDETRYGHQTNVIYIVVMAILIIVAIVVLFLLCKKK